MKTFRTPNGVFALVRLSLVIILDDFQRERRPSLLKYLEENWNELLVGPICVCPIKGGKYHAVDGGHRVTVMKRKAGKKDPLILVQLVNSPADFVGLNHHMSVNKNDQFKVMLQCGEQPYKRVAGILNRLGVGIHYGSKPRLGFTAAPAAFKDLYDTLQQKGYNFTKATSTLVECFTRKEDGVVEPAALSADFVRGYKAFLLRLLPSFTWEEVGAGLQNSPNTAQEIALKGRQIATNGGGRWVEIANILAKIVERHNRYKQAA